MQAAATNELLGYCKMFIGMIEPHVKFEFHMKDCVQGPIATALEVETKFKPSAACLDTGPPPTAQRCKNG
jgi:hypothetical protein